MPHLGPGTPGNAPPAPTVCRVVPDWLLDLLLPATDQAVRTQWIVASLFWAAAIALARRANREVGMLAIGLALCTLAWFLLRAAH